MLITLKIKDMLLLLFEIILYDSVIHSPPLSFPLFLHPPPPHQAHEELESWGLQLDPKLTQVMGRHLAPEKILFRKSTVVANEEADWGRDAVKENVISAVST